MKTVGIVGGMGPESTVDYYKLIINQIQEEIGRKDVLPELYINSINMYKMFTLLVNGQLKELVLYLTDAVQKLENIGADFVVMSANTPHIFFDQVQQEVQVPMISLVEETYLKTEELGLKKIGLLGTKFTMEMDFFKTPFISGNREIVVPNQSEQDFIHRKIVEELEHGIVNIETKTEFLNIINNMIYRNQIDGVILGCTELPMLIKKEDITISQLNTTEIHVAKIVKTIVDN